MSCGVGMLEPPYGPLPMRCPHVRIDLRALFLACTNATSSCSRSRRRSSFLGHPDAKFFRKTSRKDMKEAEHKKGYILIEVKKGTF